MTMDSNPEDLQEELERLQAIPAVKFPNGREQL
jgi:hypothetical protein